MIFEVQFLILKNELSADNILILQNRHQIPLWRPIKYRCCVKENQG